MPVKTLSIFSLLFLSRLSVGLTTVLSHTFSINEKRISAIAALLSSPRSFSICNIRCSIVSFSFWSSCSFSNTSSSPSISFEAANLKGTPALSAWSDIISHIACIQRCTAPPKSFSSQKSCLPGRS